MDGAGDAGGRARRRRKRPCCDAREKKTRFFLWWKGRCTDGATAWNDVNGTDHRDGVLERAHDARDATCDETVRCFVRSAWMGRVTAIGGRAGAEHTVGHHVHARCAQVFGAIGILDGQKIPSSGGSEAEEVWAALRRSVRSSV